MEYQALYRRYRPSLFSDVIGQEHITTVLKNQIKTGKISHAYLFSGTRGTGKTSTARILAKAVNCENPNDGEPCGACPSCLAIAEGSIDIIELDAASNNSVDNIRSLIETAAFAPINLKKKVYIIDEAHMLSASAFNALLKTLEEPPSHILFILATTEPHKIIPTITSRCQRFEFKRLRTADILTCLKSVITAVGAEIEPDGLTTIARKANGGMRDALSLADQCISFCGNYVSSADVNHMLGSADSDVISEFAALLSGSDISAALQKFDEIYAGKDISVLIQDLSSYFRSLMIAKLCGGNCGDILDCSEEEMKVISAQSENISISRITRAIDILTSTQSNIKYYPQPRILFEAAIVKILTPDSETTIEAMTDRIAVLEDKLKNPALIQVQAPKQEAEPDKQKKDAPKKKSRPPVSKNALDLLKRLCEDTKSSNDPGAMFLYVSLSQANNAEIIGDEFHLSFASPTICRTVSEHRKFIQSLLDGYESGLSVVFHNQAVSDGDGLDALLSSNFGDDITIVD